MPPEVLQSHRESRLLHKTESEYLDALLRYQEEVGRLQNKVLYWQDRYYQIEKQLLATEESLRTCMVTLEQVRK